MKTVEIELPGDARATCADGPESSSRSGRSSRRTMAEPALTAMFRPGMPYEWQYVATMRTRSPRMSSGPPRDQDRRRRHRRGLRHPDLAAKCPELGCRSPPGYVKDNDGHGTFVSALATGSVDNSEGIAGFGGDARLLMSRPRRRRHFSDVDEAAAIIYAVDHGARSSISRSAARERRHSSSGRPIRGEQQRAPGRRRRQRVRGGEPDRISRRRASAAWLERTGRFGLSVGASTITGKRAFFRTPARRSRSPPRAKTSSETSHRPPRRSGGRATPSPVAGRPLRLVERDVVLEPGGRRRGGARLGREPVADAQQVAAILKATASGNGKWNPRLGYGVIDVAAAVAKAQGHSVEPRARAGAWISVHQVSSRGFRSVRSLSHRPHGLRPLRLAVHLRTSAPLVPPEYRRSPFRYGAAAAGTGSPAGRRAPAVGSAGRSASRRATTCSARSTAAAGISAARSGSSRSAFARPRRARCGRRVP